MARFWKLLGVSLLALAILAASACGSEGVSQEKYDQLEQEITTTQEELKNSQDEVASLKQELGTTRERLNRVEDEFSSTKDDLGSAKDSLTSVKAKLSSAQESLQQKEEQLASTRVELEDTKDELKQELTKTQEELKNTQDELASLKQDVESNKENLARLEDVENKIATISSDLSNLEDSISSLQGQGVAYLEVFTGSRFYPSGSTFSTLPMAHPGDDVIVVGSGFGGDTVHIFLGAQKLKTVDASAPAFREHIHIPSDLPVGDPGMYSLYTLAATDGISTGICLLRIGKSRY